MFHSVRHVHRIGEGGRSRTMFVNIAYARPPAMNERTVLVKPRRLLPSCTCRYVCTYVRTYVHRSRQLSVVKSPERHIRRDIKAPIPLPDIRVGYIVGFIFFSSSSSSSSSVALDLSSSEGTSIGHESRYYDCNECNVTRARSSLPPSNSDRLGEMHH